MKNRVVDEEEEVVKKKKEMEDEEEEEEKKPKAKDEESEAEEKKNKKAEDSRFVRLLDALEKIVEKKKTDDEDEEETEKPKKHEESEDADLIPVETLSGKEIPKNPIPGADKALDALRKIRSVVADSGDRKVMDAYNDAVMALKGKVRDKAHDGYSRVVRASERDRLDEGSRQRTSDSQNNAATFTETARAFHRKNPGEAKLELLQREAK